MDSGYLLSSWYSQRQISDHRIFVCVIAQRDILENNLALIRPIISHP